jgi:hypothetical protein
MMLKTGSQFDAFSTLGTTQGPFTCADICDWLEGGYFPVNLPMKHAALPASVPFVALQEMLPYWAKGDSGMQVSS